MEGSDHGSTDTDEKRIYINTNFKEECQRETLLHELLHVAFMDCSLFKHPIENDEDQEEFLIRYASPKIFQMFRDNEELKEFIFG
jgi:Zn-dependent peptidase ImmA (M78 family)